MDMTQDDKSDGRSKKRQGSTTLFLGILIGIYIDRTSTVISFLDNVAVAPSLITDDLPPGHHYYLNE